ncbi:MAG: ParB/RepB/Spo0J family partition protein [Gemmatimonadaceae bacterium]|nr:ParB/RepB/Spo0J family partition protein [Gemmatimonadaceae bacterium]
MTDKPRRLGRGLEALIAAAGSLPASVSHAAPGSSAASDAATASELPFRSLPVAQIRPNPFQPRRDFKPEELTDLENSIRASGLLQPVTVRERPDGGFELVAGERRLRAATRLGWSEIPAMVKTLDDREMLTLALIENLQRSDLNPLDEALGFQRLLDEFALTQQQVADAVGKDRSTVANLLRVLQLPDGIKRLLRDGQISLGHARALLAMPNERLMLDTARQIVERGLSVREAERIAQEARPADTRPKAGHHAAERGRDSHTAELRRLTELLRRHLQTDVRISVEGDAKGDISIRFYSADDLHRLMETILGRSLDEA